MHLTDIQFIREVFFDETIPNNMHNFEVQVRKMMENLQVVFAERIKADGNFYFYPHKPKLSDIELLAISTVAESLSINSENALFCRIGKEIPHLFSGRITRPRFNIRRRSLNIHMEDFLKLSHERLLAPDYTFIVDSTPLPICKLARIRRLKVCRDNPEIAPQLATCYAKNEKYYGFKMHLITTQKNAIPVAFSITSARVHDVKALEQMLDDQAISTGQLLGDKGYVSNPLQLELFENKKIELRAQPRINMKTPFNWTPAMGAIRRRIETVFSQCQDQFRMGQNFAKSFHGMVTRITHKLSGILFCQLINIQNNRNPNLIKSALFA